MKKKMKSYNNILTSVFLFVKLLNDTNLYLFRKASIHYYTFVNKTSR